MNSRWSILAAAALAASLSWGAIGKADPAKLAAGPTFPCTSPSAIESIICNDASLAAADRRMAALYQAAKSGSMNNGSNQLTVQRQWLKDRDAHCSSGAWKKFGHASAHDCVLSAYNDRLKALAVADLLSAPQLSLPELRTVAPKAAPYYEALLAYASIDSPTERTKAVEAKLAPLYVQMSPDVRDGLGYVGKDALTARGAASSDAGFLQLFDLSSMNADLDLIWPCAALIRRPGLIAGLGSIWGGTIDNQVPDSDCEQTLPSPPELNTLTQAVFKAQPPCEGTIRFSTGREYAKLEDAVRLHRRDVWREQSAAPSPDEAAFRRRKAALVGRTSEALTAYYTLYFHSNRTDAVVDGKAATNALVSAAFGYCG